MSPLLGKVSALERKNSTETVSDALWMGLLAGLGGVFILVYR